MFDAADTERALELRDFEAFAGDFGIVEVSKTPTLSRSSSTILGYVKDVKGDAQ